MNLDKYKPIHRITGVVVDQGRLLVVSVNDEHEIILKNTRENLFTVYKAQRELVNEY